MRIIEEGNLRGGFQGFKNTDTIFAFQGGGRWRQAEYRYSYYYSYAPRARVLEKGGAVFLAVDGMNESVLVVSA